VEYGPAVRYVGIDLAQTLNRVSNVASLTAGYRLTPFATVAFGSSMAADRFPNSMERNVHSARQFVGMQLGARAVVKGDFEIAYRTTTGTSRRSMDFSGFVPRAALSYTFHDTTSVSVGARHDIDYSFSPAQPFFAYSTYEGSVRQALFHRFDIGASLSQTQLHYHTFSDVAFNPIVTEESDQRIRNLAMSFGLIVKRDTRVAVYIARWQRLDGNRPYVSTLVGLQVVRGRLNLSPGGIFLNGPSR
jgi:hypothetical protein